MWRLPSHLREQLAEPIGDLVDEPQLLERAQDLHPFISIGDMVTKTFLSHGIIPDISIVDYLHKRSQVDSATKQLITQQKATVYTVKNPPSTITEELHDTIKFCLDHLDGGPQRIEVEGEEDLASLAAIQLAPEGVTVIYGLPNRGVIIVTVNTYHKQKVQTILEKM